MEQPREQWACLGNDRSCEGTAQDYENTLLQRTELDPGDHSGHDRRAPSTAGTVGDRFATFVHSNSELRD
jgi:hypothetical protein